MLADMGFRVLLVEPDASLSEEIRRAFGPLGFTVAAVASGEQALERCRREPPELILLAAELPDMSGFSVCNRLKRALGSVPLLVYTGEATDSAIEAHRATRTRADDYLRKPFELAELLGRAAALLHADSPAPPPPPAPPSAPRLDGRRPPAPEAEGPPVLQRVPSGQVASRGLANALAAASRPPPEPPAAPASPPAPPATPAPVAPPPASSPAEASATPRPGPPPVPPARPQATLAKLKVPRADPADVLSEWPRDPSPPKGTPDEKLEYFRERLRVRDAFLAKVRDAISQLKAELAEASGARDLLQDSLDHEKASAEELSHRLQEAGQDGAALKAQLEDLRGKLAESETTRQSLSEVLNETMRQHEDSEQAWSARVAAAEEARARLEAELTDAHDGHARAVASLEADRADERARLEASRAEAEANAQGALSHLEEERHAEREAAAARLDAAQARIEEVTGERDALEAERARLAAALADREQALAELEARAAEAQREAGAEAEAARARLEESEARLQLTAGERDDAQARIASLELEATRAADSRHQLEEMLRHARAETRAHEEKSIAAEHAFQAKGAELLAAEQRIADLTNAIEEGRASVEGTRGELSRVEAGRAEAERRAAEAVAGRDQLARELDAARRAVEADRERTRRLEAEVQRLGRLEPVAEEAARLRKEVGSLRDMVQQRTQAAESASRAAQAAAAERAKVEERLAVEAGKMQGGMTRLEADLTAARRRVAEVEAERNARAAELARARADLERAQAEQGRAASAAEARQKAVSTEAGELEHRHQAEVARLKAAMVDLEKHLEARARGEIAARKRVQELERAAAAPRPAAADPAEIARLKQALQKLAAEEEELRGENDFLNGEVARYVQKNKDLATQLASLKEA
jgi:CheY-like chemotaxis protein